MTQYNCPQHSRPEITRLERILDREDAVLSSAIHSKGSNLAVYVIDLSLRANRSDEFLGSVFPVAKRKDVVCVFTRFVFWLVHCVFVCVFGTVCICISVCVYILVLGR